MKLFTEIFGYPVYYEPRCIDMAHSRGLLWTKRIVVGPRWFKLDHYQRVAVLLHEVGHLARWHLEKRVLLFPLLFFFLGWVTEKARSQELEADRFAAELGFGVELAAMLEEQRFSVQGEFYPPVEIRIQKLREVNDACMAP